MPKPLKTGQGGSKKLTEVLRHLAKQAEAVVFLRSSIGFLWVFYGPCCVLWMIFDSTAYLRKAF